MDTQRKQHIPGRLTVGALHARLDPYQRAYLASVRVELREVDWHEGRAVLVVVPAGVGVAKLSLCNDSEAEAFIELIDESAEMGWRELGFSHRLTKLAEELFVSRRGL